MRMAGADAIESLAIPSFPRKREPIHLPARADEWVPAFAGMTNNERGGSACLGVHWLGSRAFIGIGLPFGRITADELGALAISAERLGGTELRLTPWRAILVPLPSIEAAHALVAGRGDSSFILDPRDPLRQVSACVCAHPKAAAMTLVGQNGRYALVRDGAPWDSPVRKNLTLAEAGRLISAQGAAP
jgi:sulfite reductase beta subunit-like hemoprotein